MYTQTIQILHFFNFIYINCSLISFHYRVTAQTAYKK